MNFHIEGIFNDFLQDTSTELGTFGKHFQVVVHVLPDHPWPKTLINSFTELVLEQELN